MPRPEDAAAYGPTPGAFGSAVGRGVIRAQAADFRVTELLDVAFSDDGEHLWLEVEKRGANTTWVAGELARRLGVGRRAVGYSGLKDRHAVTRQWFSVAAAAADPMPLLADIGDVSVLRWRRHRRKLRRGTHRANHFELRVTGLQADVPALERRLGELRERGFPNFFAAQRFGREGGNLALAREMLLEGRHLPARRRGYALSAARAWFFNRVLALRVESRCWDRLLPNEYVLLAGKRSFFHAEDPPDAALQARCRRGDVNPSGPLPGRPVGPDGRPEPEEACMAAHPQWLAALTAARVEESRRSLRVLVPDLHWQLAEQTLELTFTLPAGSFATALLAQSLELQDASGADTEIWY